MKSAENTSLFRDDSRIDDSKDASLVSIPNTTRTISSAGYDFCGEPLSAQHLILDFTPIEGVDSECVSKKVCSFWDFIHATPEMKNLMVRPEQEVLTKKSKSSTPTETIHPESESEDHKVEKTAVEYLRFANERGMLDGTRFPKSWSRNTMGSQDYPVGELDTMQDKKANVCTCANTKSTCCTYPMKSATGQSQTLKDWDAKHHRNTDPPGHPPSLQHSIMQRQVHH